jgi:hypothetical protein
MKLVTSRTSLALLGALAVLLPATASAAPVATDDGSYQVLGRVFPDPQGACNQGPCSPGAEGNVPATTFLSYADFISALKYMNDPTAGTGPKTWQHYMEVWTLDGDLDGNDDTKAGTDEKANFPGDNLGAWEFTPNGASHSAGLPTSDVGRLKSDIVVVRVTDESVPDAGKQRMALSLSIHGIERAGVEGGTRAMEDLVTAATSGKLDKPILTTKGLGVSVPTFKDVLKKTIIYFTYPNPDGWRRGDSDAVKGPGLYFQRYNGNGVDVNRDFPDIGFAFRRYSGLSEPESRGWSSAFKQIKAEHGPFSAGDDLHGQLGADSFSFTLLPHGSHDYAKNERIRNAAQTINLVQQNVLSWSPLIQANDQPRGSCNNKPVVGADCYPMYGQNWGTVYDTINYTTTGALGDFMDSSIGLQADGIDNEMSYSHLDKDIAFEPLIEQMHVDGNKGLIFAHLSQILDKSTFVFPARGRHGYVANSRIQRAASTTTAGAPPGTHAQDPIDATVTVADSQSQDFTQTFEVKQGGEIYNGGFRVDVTNTNIQGIDPTAQSGHTLQVECKGCDKHRGVPDADEKDWTVVADDYNQSGIYAQAGLTVAVNDPQSSGGASKVEWRAKVQGALPPQAHFHVEFTQGPATSDGATGGDAAPRLAAYDVASTDFWKKLDPFTVNGAGFTAVDADKLAKDDAAQVPTSLDTLILSDQPLPGYSFPALPDVKLPADVNKTDTHPTAPCGYTDGLPHSPTCGESFDIKFTEKGAGRMVVTLTPTSGDLTLTVAKVSDDGSSETQIGGTSDQGGDGGAETVAVAYPDPGTYRVYVDNFTAAPDSSWKTNVHWEAPSIGKAGGSSNYTDAEFQRYAAKLKAFVSGGGNLVLTDGAMQVLPYLFDAIKRTDVTRNISYVGQVAFTTKETDSQDAPTDGNTLKDPLAVNVARQGARFNSGLRRQTFEPTPIGFSIQDKTGGNADNSPVWLVRREAFTAAGGRITATGTNGEADLVSQVTVGELKLGKGVVRIAGALLPEPSEDFDHQEGLEPFAVTYTGYTLAENLTDWCNPDRNCVDPKTVGAAGSSAKACIASRTFRSASVRGRGKGLRFSFKRSGTNPVRVDLFQVSKARRVLREHLVARFTSRKAIDWNGKSSAHFKPTDGYYFARFRVKAANGFPEYKRIALRRSHGRWARQKQFFGTETCGLLRQFKLSRMVFGGSNRVALSASYLLARRTKLTLTVYRGKKVVFRSTSKKAIAGKVVHKRVGKSSLPKGLYRVRIVVGTGKSARRATLYSRRI